MLKIRSVSFISPETASDLLRNVSSSFSKKSKALISNFDSTETVVPLRIPLMLLSSAVEARPLVALSNEIRPSLPDFFVFGHVLPRSELLSNEAKTLCVQARQIWSTAISSEALSVEDRDALHSAVRAILRDLMTDVRSRAS